MKLTLVVPDLAANALGRAYCWWLLASEVGWPLAVIGPSSTGELWGPLARTDFHAVCTEVDEVTLPEAVDQERRRSDLVVAIKPLPGSFGVVDAVHRGTSSPFLLDIDDADLDAWIADLPLHARLGLVRPHRWAKGQHTFQLYALRRRAETVRSTVSNPELQRMYGGHVLPHVRRERPAGAPHTTDRPTVAFVGTPRAHKGLAVLREAVSSLSGDGYTLVVTGSEPHDARPWESWVDETTMAEGLRIVDTSDIVVIPSLSIPYATAQFPVKLIDAMISGRAVVASDLPVLRWALGGAGVLTAPGSVSHLADALRQVREPRARRRMGAAVRRRALRAFVPGGVAGPWSELLAETVRGGASASGSP